MCTSKHIETVRLVVNVEVKIIWKEENKKYLNAVQKFLDKAENIKEEKLREEIIGQMLKCDEILTELAIQEINKNKKQKNDE